MASGSISTWGGAAGGGVVGGVGGGEGADAAEGATAAAPGAGLACDAGSSCPGAVQASVKQAAAQQSSRRGAGRMGNPFVLSVVAWLAAVHRAAACMLPVDHRRGCCAIGPKSY
jgi:hypothetical protein